jgi:uncharacterized protein with HEPN domain
MSTRDWKFRIKDILTAIDKIERYVDDANMSQFQKNELVVDAVIRNFEIIGEASKNIPKSIRGAYSNIPWDEMCGIRDILIHEYFGVDIKILWHTAKKYLPPLRKQLHALLKEKEI